MTEQCTLCYVERDKSAFKKNRVVYFLKHPQVQYEQFLEGFLRNKLAKPMTIVVGTHLAKVEFEGNVSKCVLQESFMEDNTVKLVSKKEFDKKNKCHEFRTIEQSNRYLGKQGQTISFLQKKSIVRKTNGEEFIQSHYKLLFDKSNIKRQTKDSRLNAANMKQHQEFHIIKVKAKPPSDESQEQFKFIEDTNNTSILNI